MNETKEITMFKIDGDDIVLANNREQAREAVAGFLAFKRDPSSMLSPDGGGPTRGERYEAERAVEEVETYGKATVGGVTVKCLTEAEAEKEQRREEALDRILANSLAVGREVV